MRKIFACALIAAFMLSLGAIAFAETVEYSYVCYTNEVSTFARAKKADSERRFYVRQTETSDPFPVTYTSRNRFGTVVSNGIHFDASETGRKKNSYHSDHTVEVNEYYKLGAFPYDGVYEGRAALQVVGRWTP